MFRFMNLWFFIFLFSCGAMAHSQPAIQSSGALVIVPAYSQVTHPNDEARITFMVEEQDKDKVAAASRANQKMKQGTDIIKREDATASLKTHGYYTYPIYPDDQPRPLGKARNAVAWRVGQYVEVKTTNLAHLATTVAAAQRVLALNGLQFGLTETTMKKLDEQRIAAAYKNLNDRIAAIAKAMGRNLSDAVLDTVDFEGSGGYVPKAEMAGLAVMRSGARQDQATVEEPSFEPGETTLEMRIVGRIKFR